MKRAFPAFLRAGLQHYKQLTPSWNEVNQLLHTQDEKIDDQHDPCIDHADQHIDHVAWRSFQSHGGIDLAARVIEREGYQEQDHYEFPAMHVRAKWFAAPDLPHLFISELEDSRLPGDVQEIIHSHRCQMGGIEWTGAETGSSLTRHGLSWDNYCRLESVSRYGAWVYAFGQTLNHATINVGVAGQGLGINAAVTRLLGAGYKMNGTVHNTVCGPGVLALPVGSLLQYAQHFIHRSGDGLLLQASTAADETEVQFLEREKKLPTAFVELIERRPDFKTGKPRQGFHTDNASKIFTSTDRNQMKKKKLN